MATVSFGSLYPGRPSTQQTTNPTEGTAQRPVAGGALRGDNIPVLPGIASAAGVSVPMLVALAVFTWWALTLYD